MCQIAMIRRLTESAGWSTNGPGIVAQGRFERRIPRSPSLRIGAFSGFQTRRTARSFDSGGCFVITGNIPNPFRGARPSHQTRGETTRPPHRESGTDRPVGAPVREHYLLIHSLPLHLRQLHGNGRDPHPLVHTRTTSKRRFPKSQREAMRTVLVGSYDVSTISCRRRACPRPLRNVRSICF